MGAFDLPGKIPDEVAQILVRVDPIVDLAHGMEHRSVIAPAKLLRDFRVGMRRLLPCKVLRDVPWSAELLQPAAAEQVTAFDLKI